MYRHRIVTLLILLLFEPCASKKVYTASSTAPNPSKTVSTASSTTPNPSKTVSTASSTTPIPSKTVSTVSSTTPNPSKTVSTASSTTPNPSKTVSTASSTTPNPSKTASTASSTTPNPSKTVSTTSSTTPNPSKTVSTVSSTTPNPSKTVSTVSSTTPNPSKTVSTASSTTPNPSKTVSTASSTTPNPSKTVSTASSTTPNPSKTVSTASSTTHNASSTTSASLGIETTQAHNNADSDDLVPAAIAVSVVVSVIIVVLVVVFLMYRRGQCKQLLGKCTKDHRKHSPDRSDELVMGSMANANLTYDLSSVVDVNNYNEDYSEIDKVDKENYYEYSQVNFKRKQPVHDLTYNHIGHFNRSSEDTQHTYNHVGDETSPKSDSSTLQPDTYSHVGAMARPAFGHLAEDLYAHINGVTKDLPAAYEMNQYDCAVFQSKGGQTGNSGHRGNEIKSGKENTFIVVGRIKVDMNSDAPVSHLYFVLEKHEK